MNTSIFSNKEKRSFSDDPVYKEHRKDKDYLINLITSTYVECNYETVTGTVYTVFLLLAAIFFILKVVSFPPKWWIAVLYFIVIFIAAYIVSALIWLVLDKHTKAKQDKVRKALETMTAEELKDDAFRKKYNVEAYGKDARTALEDLIALKEGNQ